MNVFVLRRVLISEFGLDFALPVVRVQGDDESSIAADSVALVSSEAPAASTRVNEFEVHDSDSDVVPVAGSKGANQDSGAGSSSQPQPQSLSALPVVLYDSRSSTNQASIGSMNVFMSLQGSLRWTWPKWLRRLSINFKNECTHCSFGEPKQKAKERSV